MACIDWKQYRAAKNAQKLAEAQAWISGYLSGSNLDGPGPDFLDDGVDLEEFAAFIDNYCNGRPPMAGLSVAVIALKEMLQKRARQ